LVSSVNLETLLNMRKTFKYCPFNIVKGYKLVEKRKMSDKGISRSLSILVVVIVVAFALSAFVIFRPEELPPEENISPVEPEWWPEDLDWDEWSYLEGAYEGRTINIIGYKNWWMPIQQELASYFEKLTGGTIVYDVDIPEEDFIGKVYMDFETQRGEYDLIEGQWWWVTDWAESGYIEPLNDYYEGKVQGLKGIDKSQILYPGIQAFSWKDEIYGVPHSIHQTGNLEVLRDVFEEQGIEYPTTMEEVLSAAEKLGSLSDYYGIMTRADPTFVSFYTFMGWLYAYGGPLFDENMNVNINEGHRKGAHEVIPVLQKYAPPGQSSMHWYGELLHIEALDTAIAMDCDAFIWSIWSHGEHFDWVIPPKADYGYFDTTYIHGTFINAFSKNKDFAWDLQRFWLLNHSWMIKHSDMHNSPVLVSEITDPDMVAYFEERGLGQYLDVKRASLKYMSLEMFPRLPRYHEIGRIVASNLSAAVAGEVGIDEALDRIEQELEPIAKSIREDYGITKYWTYYIDDPGCPPELIYYYPPQEDVDELEKIFGPGTVLE